MYISHSGPGFSEELCYWILGCLEVQVLPSGAYAGADRGRPVESAVHARISVPRELPKWQSQPGW